MCNRHNLQSSGSVSCPPLCSGQCGHNDEGRAGLDARQEINTSGNKMQTQQLLLRNWFAVCVCERVSERVCVPFCMWTAPQETRQEGTAETNDIFSARSLLKCIDCVESERIRRRCPLQKLAHLDHFSKKEWKHAAMFRIMTGHRRRYIVLWSAQRIVLRQYSGNGDEAACPHSRVDRDWSRVTVPEVSFRHTGTFWCLAETLKAYWWTCKANSSVFRSHDPEKTARQGRLKMIKKPNSHLCLKYSNWLWTCHSL